MQSPYKIVDPYPSISKVVANIHPSEYATMVVASIISYAVPYSLTHRLERVKAARTSFLFIAFGSFTIGYAKSTLRLFGLMPNHDEVAKYGIASDQEIWKNYMASKDINGVLFRPK